jgi:hypothetical protein
MKMRFPRRLRDAGLTLGLALGLALASAMAHGAETAGVPACTATAGGEGVPPAQNVRVVTGAPYSAVGTSETVMTLADGKRVKRRNWFRLWRDSVGRTRSEYSLSAVSGPLPVELNTTVTVIDDPAAGERYMLQPGEKVAVTLPITPCRATSSLEPDLSVGPPRPADLPVRLSRPMTLGERKLEGETVAGRRIEATIPAGAIGNSKPIHMTTEQWYGKALQVVVEATYQDPRTGETRYRLSDIERSEPDAELFKVPDNYRKQPLPAPGPGARRP